MAKKSTRVLSFILSALLLVTMLSAVSLAEEAKFYTFDEAATTKNYYEKLNYLALVGPENEGDTSNVFIIDYDWAYEEGQEPDSVNFEFRGDMITETYNANRHMRSITSAVIYATENGVKNPIFILTEGVYNEKLKLANGFTVLGPKAGMNPNVPHGDPSKEWELSSDRKLPTATENFGEAVFRYEGGLGGDHSISGDSNSEGTQNYIIDGVVFQGDGSGVADESDSGEGTRNWYIQNCIFDDCHSDGGRGNGAGLGFDRRDGQKYYKNLYVSNCYVINQNTRQLYSGHASSIHFNGVSVQNSKRSLCYAIDCLQWQGQTTEITNCHFWNAKNAPRENNGNTAIYFNLNWSNYCKSGVGTDSALFYALFRNNSFYHVDATGASLFQISMAGNTKVIIEENYFGSEEGKKARSPVEIKYLTWNGKVTHEGITGKNATESSSGDYELNNDKLLIRNNTFVGSEFQKLPNIGTNKCADTKLEQLGNLYLDTSISQNGKMIDPYTEGAKVYNKWVWLNADRTEASSDIDVGSVVFTSGGEPIAMSGYDLTLLAGPKEYTKPLEVECNTQKNSVRVYASDASWVKGAQISATGGVYTLNTSMRENHFIVSILSIDQRTELNYKLTVNRELNPDAKLDGIIPQAPSRVTEETTDGTTFNYGIGYENIDFTFKLNIPETATAVVKNKGGSGTLTANNGVYTSVGHQVGVEKSYEVTVTDQDGYKEIFYINIVRDENHATELLSVSAPEATEITCLGTTYTVKVPNAAKALNLTLVTSDGARVEMTDPQYHMPILAKNGVYTINPILIGKNVYTVMVESQNGDNLQEWKILIDREGKKDCELLGIANTEKIGNMYVGYTTNKEFLISATVSEGATYQIFTDPECTLNVSSPRVSLTESSNTFWVKVFAEDPAYSSTPVKVLINTYADVDEPDDTPVKLPMNDDDILGVTGGEFKDNVVVVPLAPKTEKYTLRVQGFSGYEARVYSDNSENPMRADNTIDLTLDSGKTVLYVTATKGSGESKVVEEYTVYILAPRFYKYTDEQAAWAVDYITAVGANGLGLMKGYPDGSFGGANNLTRYEMAAMMVRVAGANVHLYTAARNPFSDIIADWAVDYVKAASRMGIINGYEIVDDEGETVYEFAGDKNATRSEFFRVFTNAVLGVDVDKYYAANQKAIDTAVNALELKDLEDIADWAKPAVYTAVYMNLVKGDHAKKVNPQANITRNEVAVVLGRYCEILEGAPSLE